MFIWHLRVVRKTFLLRKHFGFIASFQNLVIFYWRISRCKILWNILNAVRDVIYDVHKLKCGRPQKENFCVHFIISCIIWAFCTQYQSILRTPSIKSLKLDVWSCEINEIFRARESLSPRNKQDFSGSRKFIPAKFSLFIHSRKLIPAKFFLFVHSRKLILAKYKNFANLSARESFSPRKFLPLK